MNRHIFIYPIAFCLVLAHLTSFAQPTPRTCATMDHLEVQKLEDPQLELRMENIQQMTERLLDGPQTNAVEGVITIPVVVHVVYNADVENISEEQIFSQIQILNEDFRRLNNDADDVWPQAADTEFEFCLASRDPDGYYTTGITRTFTDQTSFSFNNAVKFSAQGGKDAWPTDSYLNIWVCNLDGLLGYAQFPGGNAATDGVVCLYSAFGNVGTATSPFDLGRTATHEVGHWLNLRHIWGDGGCPFDDFVADTPISDAANYGCDIGHISCTTEDMVQNYMDYSDDACMNLFTQGQTDRMRALFEPGLPRESLLSSLGCQAPPAPNLNLEITTAILNVTGTNVSASIRVINDGAGTAGASTVRYYLSANTAISALDYEIGSDPVTALSSGSGSDESIDIDVSTLPIPAGNYYFGFIIDADEEVSESNENDNIWYWSTPQVTISEAVCQGDDLVQAEVLTSGSYEFWAANTIIASDQVLAGVKADYYAGTSVTFQPGTYFHVGAGVLAKIQTCVSAALGSEDIVVEERTPGQLFDQVNHTRLRLKAYPNPFDRSTTLEYSLSEKGKVYLYLFDMLGKPIRTLENGEIKEVGSYRVQLEAATLSPGTYFVVMRSGGMRQNLRITVLR